MNISVDGGALCSDHTFGNYTYTYNFLQALRQYDRINNYFIYSFSKDISFEFKENIKQKVLKPSALWMKFRVPIEELLHKKQYFLALNQSIPLFTQSKVISFSHGLSFMQYPDLYSDSHTKMKSQLDDMISRSTHILVSSSKVADEINSLYPDQSEKIKVLPFGIPYDCQEYRKTKREKLFVFCGMNHPIKNVDRLVSLFEKFLQEQPEYKLILIGPFNQYKHKPGIKVYEALSRSEIVNVYRSASAYITTSLYESFNFPVLEALSQHCPVVALRSAVIPEMEKYCLLSDDEQSLLTKLHIIASTEYKVNAIDLNSVFSWKTYIEQLLSLYRI